MKKFGVILLALLSGYFGFQVAYPKLEAWAQFETQPEITPVKQSESQVPQVPQVSPKQLEKLEQPEQRVQTPVDEPKLPASKPATEAPVIVQEMTAPEASPKPTPAVVAEVPKIESHPDEFQAPVFPPIEEIVKGWKEIPKKAFPREVTALKEVEFIVSKDGNKFRTLVASGGKVYVLDQDGDKLIVTPAPTSPARATLAIGDTNLKELLTEGYERWKPKMVEYLRRQWSFKKMARSNPDGASNPKLASRNDKPERNPDGTYPILLASMKSGGVTEITPANIKKWGNLNVERIDGQEYYTVIVDYIAKTMFGNFETSAQARIRNGKVVKWIYTGSGEEVP